MSRCQYDTGSMYDNRAWCPAEATHSITYRAPCYPAATILVCSRHAGPTKGRLYPYDLTVTELDGRRSSQSA